MLLEVRLLQRDTQGAVRIADDILRSDPGNLEARLARALAFVLQARPDQAREDLLTALAIHKGSNEARLRLAILDLSQKRYREAEKGFAMVVQAGDPRGSIGLAQSRAAQGHVTAAIDDLRKECASFPALYECQSALASMELRTGQFPEAKDGFERLIQRNPNAAEPYLGLAEAQVKLGDSAGALATFRKARQVDPSNAQAILGIAVLLDTSGQKAQAAAAYQEVLAINSGNAMALNNLAYIKAEQGVDLDRALAMAQSAVQKSPENPDYLDTLGLVYYKRSLIAASIDVFERLVTKKPNNPSFHLHMAMALYAARKTDLAAGELQKAMLYKPSQVEQIEIRDLAMKLHLPTERMESR